MLLLNDALIIIDRVLSKHEVKLPIEEVPLISCLNRVLADPQISRINLPPFNKAIMDGYAILAVDKVAQRNEYQLIETVAAGSFPKRKLLSGTCTKVMTGAPVPDKAEIVVPIEMTEELAGKMKISKWPLVTNVHKISADVKYGEQILAKGRALNSIGISNLIACGINSVPVYRKLRVVIISTGSEIVNDFTKLNDGKIIDSNGPMLQLLCQRYGMDVVTKLQVNDDHASTVTALKSSLAKADMILFSGGASVGDFDYVNKALIEAGLTIHFNRVAIKPGKPITFSTNHINSIVVFALPGNPIAAYLTFHLFILYAIEIILGTSFSEVVKYITLPLSESFHRIQIERTEYVPCQLLHDGTLIPQVPHSSGHLAILRNCNGFFIVPYGVKEYNRGERVEFLHIIDF